MLKSNKSLLIFFCSLFNRLEKFLVLFNVLNFFFLICCFPVNIKIKKVKQKIQLIYF